MRPWQVAGGGLVLVGAAVGIGFAGWCAYESLGVQRRNELHDAMLAESTVLRKRMEIARGDELEAQARALGKLKPWPASRGEDRWLVEPERLCVGSGLAVDVDRPSAGAGAPFECSACGRIFAVRWATSGVRRLVLPDHLPPAGVQQLLADDAADDVGFGGGVTLE